MAYRQLAAERDPARRWLADGEEDVRFVAGDLPPHGIRRGPQDLAELHAIIDELFGIGCFARPGPTGQRVQAVVTGQLPVPRPAIVMPFLEALRPQLEGRGPAFWTWKSAREAIAARLQGLDHLTVEAVLT